MNFAKILAATAAIVLLVLAIVSGAVGDAWRAFAGLSDGRQVFALVIALAAVYGLHRLNLTACGNYGIPRLSFAVGRLATFAVGMAVAVKLAALAWRALA